MDFALTWDFIEGFLPEDEIIIAARMASRELGITSVAPSVGNQLAATARMIGARSVIEVGTGCGVSALYLLKGLGSVGVLTTIDSEMEVQKVARTAISRANLNSNQTRFLTGRALNLLPRLNLSAYDMMVADGDPTELPEYLEHARRILRPGGVLIVPGVLGGDKVPNPARRDPVTSAQRKTLNSLREGGDFSFYISPAGGGVLTATKLRAR